MDNGGSLASGAHQSDPDDVAPYPNLTGRTALFLYPLASLLLATALPLIWRAKQVQLQYVTAGMVALLGIIHLSGYHKAESGSRMVVRCR